MSLTDEERARAVSYLRATKQQVLQASAELTAEQWQFHPSPSAWNPRQCIEHITLVEIAMLRTVQGMANDPEASAEALAQAAGKDDLLIRAIRSRKHRVDAPAAAHPAVEPSAPDAAPVAERFARVRDRSIHYLETTADPLRRRVHPHYLLGPFDGYQWMLFLGAHAERHLRQIQETKEHPEFPK